MSNVSIEQLEAAAVRAMHGLEVGRSEKIIINNFLEMFFSDLSVSKVGRVSLESRTALVSLSNAAMDEAAGLRHERRIASLVTIPSRDKAVNRYAFWPYSRSI